jgi:hypothetical protein
VLPEKFGKAFDGDSPKVASDGADQVLDGRTVADGIEPEQPELGSQ